MTPRLRLNAWRCVVVVAVGGNAVYAANAATVAAVVAEASLIAMFGLLLTTPAEAIVLPRKTSERLIVAGFVLPALTAGPNMLALAIGFAGGLGIAACRWRSISAWWAALAFWQPLLFSAVRSS